MATRHRDSSPSVDTTGGFVERTVSHVASPSPRTVATTTLSAPAPSVPRPRDAPSSAQVAADFERSRAQAGFDRGPGAGQLYAGALLASPVADQPVRVVRQSALTIAAPVSRPVSAPARTSSHMSVANSTPARVKSDVKKAEPVREERRRPVVCKPRPEDNRPRSGGGGGGKKKFVPWC